MNNTSYYVVQTVEKGNRVLSVAPAHWISDGVLRWPPINMNGSKMAMKGIAKPAPSWRRMKYTIKSTAQASYESAYAIASAMSDESASSGFDLVPKYPKMAKNFISGSEAIISAVRPNPNTNLTCTPTSTRVLLQPSPVSTLKRRLDTPHLQASQAFSDLDDIYTTSDDNSDVNEHNLEFPYSEANDPLNDDVINNTGNVKSLFKTLLRQQSTILKKIEEIERNRQDFEKNLLAVVESRLQQYGRSSTATESEPRSQQLFKQIEDEKTLLEFEIKLRNSDYMAKMVRKT